jgi:hypothetical protein
MIPFESTTKPYRDDWLKFKVGTCEGLWRATPTSYEILAVKNKQKGNGHFQQVMNHFETSCRRDHKKFIVRECWNFWKLAPILKKLGFQREPWSFDWVKSYYV